MSGSDTNDDKDGTVTRDGTDTARRNLSPAAKRALEEAEARRAEEAKKVQGAPREIGGAPGPDPARYGDWEKDGIVSDF